MSFACPRASATFLPHGRSAPRIPLRHSPLLPSSSRRGQGITPARRLEIIPSNRALAPGSWSCRRRPAAPSPWRGPSSGCRSTNEAERKRTRGDPRRPRLQPRPLHPWGRSRAGPLAAASGSVPQGAPASIPSTKPPPPHHRHGWYRIQFRNRCSSARVRRQAGERPSDAGGPNSSAVARKPGPLRVAVGTARPVA